jgi:hypothetical protein
MQQKSFFLEIFDCIIFFTKFFSKKENGNIWKYLEIFGNKKTQKKHNWNTRNIFITNIQTFYLYSLCKMTAWKYLEIKKPKKNLKTSNCIW